MLVGAELRDGERAEADGGQQRQRRDVAADLFEHHAQLHQPVAAAARSLGKRNSEEVGVGELLPDPAIERLRRVLQLEETLGGDLLSEDLAGEVLQVTLHVVEREVHRGASVTDRTEPTIVELRDREPARQPHL